MFNAVDDIWRKTMDQVNDDRSITALADVENIKPHFE
jgi:hypothetical protein